MKRAALYARVSTDQQVRDGDSIEAQLSALRDYAKKHNYIIAGEYIDDGVSGTKYDERDQLQKLLTDVRKRSVDVICFCKLDRWFRSIRHYLNTQAVLDEYHVGWIAIWENYDTTTPAGRLMVNQMLSFAQFEAENTAMRTQHVFDYKKSQHEVVSGKVPFGYSIVDKHMVPNEDAATVRMVFQKFLDTGVICQVLRETKGLGLPTTQRGLKCLLQNRKYLGEAYGYSDFCEPIVDREIFDAVQRMLKTSVRANSKHDYLFSGLVFCKECGRRMAGGSYQDKQKEHARKYYHYRCFGYYRILPDCKNNKKLSESKFERMLVKNLEEYAFGDVQAEEAKDKIDYAKLIESTERKIAKLKDLYVNELITLDEYKKDVAAYRNQINDYTKHLDDEGTTGKEKLKDLIGLNLADWYWTLTDAEKRTLWRSVIKRIECGSDGSVDVTFL